MGLFWRGLVSALLLYSPSILGAPLHKCTDADGKVYYQDSACPSHSNTEQPKLEGSTRSTGAKGLKMPDQACIQALEQEAKRCVPIIQNNVNVIKQCMRERLSPECAKQYESDNRMPKDKVCQQELEKASRPCGEKLMAMNEQCTHERLSQDCVNQISSYEKSAQEMQNNCVAAMRRISQLCSTEKGESYFRCLGQHKGEAAIACGESK
jgi:hypothetical protein